MGAFNKENQVQFESRGAWRQWLEQHHASSNGVWLISYKLAAGKPRVSYEETVQEALCFGWIDSKANSLDEERSMQWFSPRKKGSPWSTLNKKRIEKLLEQGLMTPAGLEKIDAAKQDGSWNIYDALEALQVPDDLQKALADNAEAQKHFNAFTDPAKRQILLWINTAKRPETRAKRITQTVALAAANKKPNQYTRNT
jgi:uncharacterized protein YdeI (YjbR/CyaY-like superfamily)